MSAVEPSTSFAQSPSIEDLLSARSKRSAGLGATTSVYSTLTTFTTAPHQHHHHHHHHHAIVDTSTVLPFDISDVARRAMAEEASNGLWSPSMDSSNDGHFDEFSTSTAGPPSSSAVGRDAMGTPNLSESDYSPNPSLASVKLASRVSNVPSATTHPARRGSIDLLTRSLGNLNNDADENTPLASLAYQKQPGQASFATNNTTPSKRVLNARNLLINTSSNSASAKAPLEHPPFTSRSLPPSSTDKPFLSPALPPAPLSAIPLHVSSNILTDSEASSHARRRSSQGSFASSFSAAPSLDEDETITMNQASLQRMQSFLGPKMKHISPAPWSTQSSSSSTREDADGSISMSMAMSESSSSFWNDDDSEVGSVHLATKTPRSRSVKDALGGLVGFGAGGPRSDLGALRGLGLAAPANGSVNSTRPSLGTLSDLKSGARKPNVSESSVPRSGSKDTLTGTLSTSTSTSPSGSGSAAGSGPMTTVTNIVRTRTPEPTSAPAQQASFLDLRHSASSSESASPAQTDSVKNVPLATAISSSYAAGASPPSAGHVVRRRSLTAEAALPLAKDRYTPSGKAPAARRPLTPPELSFSSSLPTSVGAGSGATVVAANGSKPVNITRKRPPVFQQDSTLSVDSVDSATLSHSARPIHSPSMASMASLPSPSPKPEDTAPNGLKLIPLNTAREREQARTGSSPSSMHQPLPQSQAKPPVHALPPIPTQPILPPPAASAKAIKTKKSGFLKLFKVKEGGPTPMPPVRPSLDDLPSPTVAMQNRAISNPTSFRVNDSPLSSSSGALMQPVKSDLAPMGPVSQPLNESTRRTNASAPPSVTFVSPSPDTVDISVFPAPPKTTLAQRKASQAALAPSLSLRPVSMMISSMPQDFLANLSAIETGKKRGAVSDGGRTPDGGNSPSFAFFEPECVVTPPATSFPLSPSTPSASSSTSYENGKAPFGLPTPPHSAASARTFTTLPPPPVPSTSSAMSAAKETAYQSKILELEKLIMTLKVELDAHQQAKEEKTSVESGVSSTNAKVNTKSVNEGMRGIG